jgi:hypothetical protein
MIRPMAKRKRSEHYVNNKEFLAALIKYREDKEIAAAKGLPKPPIPRYIGECFLKIANHLSFKPNFVNYMFKEDMISDGIENCVQYIHNFNPEKLRTRLLNDLVTAKCLMIITLLTDLTIRITIASKMLFTLNFAIINESSNHHRPALWM